MACVHKTSLIDDIIRQKYENEAIAAVQEEQMATGRYSDDEGSGSDSGAELRRNCFTTAADTALTDAMRFKHVGYYEDPVTGNIYEERIKRPDPPNADHSICPEDLEYQNRRLIQLYGYDPAEPRYHVDRERVNMWQGYDRVSEFDKQLDHDLARERQDLKEKVSSYFNRYNERDFPVRIKPRIRDGYVGYVKMDRETPFVVGTARGTITKDDMRTPAPVFAEKMPMSNHRAPTGEEIYKRAGGCAGGKDTIEVTAPFVTAREYKDEDFVPRKNKKKVEAKSVHGPVDGMATTRPSPFESLMAKRSKRALLQGKITRRGISMPIDEKNQLIHSTLVPKESVLAKRGRKITRRSVDPNLFQGGDPREATRDPHVTRRIGLKKGRNDNVDVSVTQTAQPEYTIIPHPTKKAILTRGRKSAFDATSIVRMGGADVEDRDKGRDPHPAKFGAQKGDQGVIYYPVDAMTSAVNNEIDYRRMLKDSRFGESNAREPGENPTSTVAQTMFGAKDKEMDPFVARGHHETRSDSVAMQKEIGQDFGLKFGYNRGRIIEPDQIEEDGDKTPTCTPRARLPLNFLVR